MIDMAGVATFSNNPNANTGITLSGSLGPGTTPIQGSNVNVQSKPVQIQGTGTPSGQTVGSSQVASNQTAINNATTQSNALSAQIAALQAQIAAANQKVYAPALDVNSIYNQASATANANVNPYYTKLLNDFVAQQATAKDQQTQQTQTNIQNLQTQLGQLQAANAVTGERSTEDTATNEAAIAAAADNRQSDQGTAFDTTRINEAKALAGSGLTGSGVAGKQQLTTQNTQDVTEARQATADQQAKDAAELGKARTFEDLTTSNATGATTEAEGEQQQTFNLNNFITGQTSDLASEQQTLEQQRQSAVATEQQNQTKILVNNFINSIANPAQRQAAIQTYGAYL